MWYFIVFVVMTVLMVNDEFILYWIASLLLGVVIISLHKRILVLEEKIVLLLEKNALYEKEKPIALNIPMPSQNKAIVQQEIHLPLEATQAIPSIDKETPTPSLYSSVYTWFTDGNTFVRLGLIILFIGFALLFKEAYDRGLISSYFPIELRLLAVALFALGLFYFGFKTVHKKRNYGLLLQGGAIGIFYLTVYVSLHLYGIFSPLFSFSIFILLSALTVVLALYFNAQSLAIFALIGAFVTPILTSTGSNNYIGLFSFYALLNLSIFTISTLKAWRRLNLMGFIFTFVIASIWGFSGAYKPAYFSTTEPFLIFFFLLYIGISIYFAKLQDIAFKNTLDSSLLFGLPIVTFFLQSAMVSKFSYGIAISTFVLGAFYLLLALSISKIFKNKMPLLREVFIALGVIFLTLSIPFALDSALSSIAWILEGTGIVWIALKQNQRYRRFLGLAIQFLGTMLFLYALVDNTTPVHLYFDTFFLSSLIVMFTLTFTAYLLSKNTKYILKIEKKLISFYLVYSQILVLLILALKGLGMLLLGATLLSLFFAWTTSKMSWKTLHTLSVVLLPIMIIVTLFEIWIEDAHLFILGGFPLFSENSLFENGIILWTFAFASLIYILHRWQRISFSHPYLNKIVISASLLFVFIGTWEMIWHSKEIFKYHSVLLTSSMPLIALVFMTLIFYSGYWFFLIHKKYLLTQTSLYIALWLIVWLLLSLWHDGGNVFGVWLPLLNPLEIIQIFTIGILYKLTKTFSQSRQRNIFKLFTLYLFVWVNIMILRTLSHWFNIAWDFDKLFAHNYTHTTLSIFWTLLGLSLTFIATRKHLRKLWIVGASLLALVVVKLFLIDLQDQDKIFATISFIVVGILLLVVGYISPLPPQKEEDL